MKLNEIVPLPHMEQSETHVTYYAMREKRHTNPTQSATTERKNGRNVSSITSAMLEEESESNNQGARVLKQRFQGFRSCDFQSSNAFRGARVLKLPFKGFRSRDFQSSNAFRGARVLKLPFKGFRSRDFQSSNAFRGARVLKLPFKGFRSHTKNFFSNPSIPSSPLRGLLIFSLPHQIFKFLMLA